MNNPQNNINDIYMVVQYASNENKNFTVHSTHASLESATIAWKQASVENPDIIVEIRKQTL